MFLLLHVELVGALLLYCSLMRMSRGGSLRGQADGRGGGVQKAVRAFLLPIVAADEASVSGFISA